MEEISMVLRGCVGCRALRKLFVVPAGAQPVPVSDRLHVGLYRQISSG
jgi:hypothetical protein